MECEPEVGSDSTTKTMEEHLDECCEYYMSMGVPYNEFWHGDYCALKYYEAVYLKKRKIQNEGMWMQGIYNFIAHQTSLGNAFRGKGDKPHEYLQKPIEFFGKTEAEEQAEAEQTRQRLIETLNTWKKEWDNNGSTDSGLTNQSIE